MILNPNLSPKKSYSLTLVNPTSSKDHGKMSQRKAVISFIHAKNSQKGVNLMSK